MSCNKLDNSLLTMMINKNIIGSVASETVLGVDNAKSGICVIGERA